MKTFKKAELDQLFKQMNYLNIAEYQGFCDKHEIPYHIYAEVSGRLEKTSAKDRKKIVLARIRNFLKTGKVQGPTVFAKNVVNFEKLKDISPTTRLHFGQYDKKNAEFFRVMRGLTDGKFKNGAIARIVMNDFWTRGKAPTLNEFAKAWLDSDAGYLENHPEAAYLTDRRANGPDSDWKNLRIKKAKTVLAVLSRI
ncbi:MAG TPA: hypothetical protein VET48_05630 [Steroidobacteraceae bacterium]|nr:hypothetical protein [Steroidobacteraceae bacterium]